MWVEWVAGNLHDGARKKRGTERLERHHPGGGRRGVRRPGHVCATGNRDLEPEPAGRVPERDPFVWNRGSRLSLGGGGTKGGRHCGFGLGSRRHQIVPEDRLATDVLDTRQAQQGALASLNRQRRGRSLRTLGAGDDEIATHAGKRVPDERREDDRHQR